MKAATIIAAGIGDVVLDGKTVKQAVDIRAGAVKPKGHDHDAKGLGS